MEGKKASSAAIDFHFDLPDDCWESIFRFIDDDEEDYNNRRYLNSLSLVSKRFLSITYRLRFSLTLPYESSLNSIFRRFTKLNSLKLSNYLDSNYILSKISLFPLKITSLNLLNQCTIPAIGLRAFSQKIKTLTSLNCSRIGNFNNIDLLLIAECFPLLQELDISYPYKYCENYNSYVDGFEALSLALIKLRKINLSGFPVNNQSLFHLFNNCKNLEEVIMFDCGEISNAGVASALRERTTLRSLSFSTTIENLDHTQLLTTSHFIDSLVSLKGLTCLVMHRMEISDELLFSIAREGLPLMKLDLLRSTAIVMLECLLSSFLGDLVSINLSHCAKLTKSALFALTKNCPSLSEIKMERSKGDIAGNSDSLGEFGVYPQLKSLYLSHNSMVSDEIIIMFASIFPNLQMLDLNGCKYISEGICQVLRKCAKIRHLNLENCSKLKLTGVNFVAPKLQVLNLSNTNVDNEALYVISKNCSGLLQLLLVGCSGVTKKGVEHVMKNCRQLREYGGLLYC